MLRKMIFTTLIALPILGIAGACEDSSKTESLHVTKKVEKAYELIISPCGKRSMMFSKYRTFTTYLSKSTGLKIELFIPRDFEEFTTRLKSQEASFLYIDPAIYLDVENVVDKDNLHVFLCGFVDEDKGKPIETGCVIARADRNIKTIKDVKGKKVIFGPRTSATKWIAAKKLFTDNAIDLEKDLAGYSYGGTCMDIVLDIFYKKADVGCIRTLMCPICKPSLYYKHSKLINVTELSHVARTPPVISNVFTCTRGTEKREMEKVVDALAGIPGLDLEERQILPADIRYGFTRVDDSAFNDLRKMAD